MLFWLELSTKDPSFFMDIFFLLFKKIIYFSYLPEKKPVLFFLVYSLRNMTATKNFLFFKVKIVDDDVEFNISNFIDLFLKDGLFEPYLDEVYGIDTHNFQLKIYNVIFKETTSKKILENIYNAICEPEIKTTKDNVDFFIQVNRPLEFRQISLYTRCLSISKTKQFKK